MSINFSDLELAIAAASMIVLAGWMYVVKSRGYI